MKNKLSPWPFLTKAQALAQLALDGFVVPEVMIFALAQWLKDSDEVMRQIENQFDEGTLAIRSSCLGEDGEHVSMAGAYLSRIHVPLESLAIRQAIEDVFASYPNTHPDHQVLIQPMVQNVLCSGVILTRVPEDGSPYYVINYDDESGRTDTVTGGAISKTVFVHRHFRSTDFDSQRLYQIVRLAKKLEEHLQRDDLDIEFVQDKDLQVHLLQVRPISTKANWNSKLDSKVQELLPFAASAIEEIQEIHSGLLGQTTLLGVMPDWNPAEMIGIHPRPLATSLYRNLITQNSWAIARAKMGYRRLPETDLMIILSGRPYIDVRASFNSFLPGALDRSVCEKLIEAWLLRLDQNPEFHDKVEFEVATTVWNFDLSTIQRQRYPDLLSPFELQRMDDAYKLLTCENIGIGENSSLQNAIATISSLEAYHNCLPTAAHGRHALLAQIRNLLIQCRDYGTIPFSVIARHAFIAEDWLRSLVRIGCLTEIRAQELRASVHTISVDLSQALALACEDPSTQPSFFNHFGHLRPGTYDILSPRYDQRGQELFGNFAPHVEQSPQFQWTEGESLEINHLLQSHGFHLDANELLQYMNLAISWREKAKFVFSKSLSLALEWLALWGSKNALSREELSWISIDQLLAGLAQPITTDPQDWLRPLINQGRENWNIGQGLKFGYLIRSPRDMFVVPQHRSTPNFVTRARCQGSVVALQAGDGASPRLQGAIACIISADPGYDWLFSQGIAGLVTQYGGANSHMAIRCREYGIPAAIGCGEMLFRKITACQEAILDAGAQNLIPKDWL